MTNHTRFTQYINELNKDESDGVLDYLFKQVELNHDLQVRLRWNVNDIAVWDSKAMLR